MFIFIYLYIDFGSSKVNFNILPRAFFARKKIWLCLLFMTVLMPAFWFWGSTMRNRIRYVFSTSMNFIQKPKQNKTCFSKSYQKRLFYGIIKYNLFSYVYIIPVSLSRPGIYIYGQYIFLIIGTWHLLSPAPEWSFLIKLTSFAFPQALLLEEWITRTLFAGGKRGFVYVCVGVSVF